MRCHNWYKKCFKNTQKPVPGPSDIQNEDSGNLSNTDMYQIQHLKRVLSQRIDCTAT